MKNQYYILTTVKIQKEKPGPKVKHVLTTFGFRNAQKVANLCMAGDRIEACVAANKGLHDAHKEDK